MQIFQRPKSKVMKNTELIVDDIGITIAVEYEYEKGKPQIEECHGQHDVSMIGSKITSVNVRFLQSGRDINILPLLHPNEIEIIESHLKYDV